MYQSRHDGRDWEQINASRLEALKHQLEVYAKHNTSWSIWLWKGKYHAGRMNLRMSRLMNRYRVPRNGLRQRGYSVSQASEAVPREKEGKLSTVPVRVPRPHSVSLPTPGVTTKVKSVTFSSQSKNGCLKRSLESENVTQRSRSSPRGL